MIATGAMFLQTSDKFNKVVHYFPIRGHSYLPHDRVFGRIEENLRKFDCIVSPSHYHELFGTYSAVKIWGLDWLTYDLKKVSQLIVKKQLGFKMGDQKVFTFLKEEPNEIGVQSVRYLIFFSQ